MKWTNKISTFVQDVTSIPSEYVQLTLVTIVTIIIINIFKEICFKIYLNGNKSEKDKYTYKRKIQLISTTLIFITTLIIWEAYIKNFMTLISFISAGTAIALRDVISNFFAGIYIRINKPFVLEDRIEVNGIKGDVVNINASNFDILEINERVNNEQSTGRIIHVPNSIVFTQPVKNYVTGFKYIWDEITVKVGLDTEVSSAKDLMYEIVTKNIIIQETPDKMQSQLRDASLDYRIYFNNLEPIIYTSVIDDHIELYIRYLVHPKKVRTVQDSIWLDIIDAHQNDKIKLFGLAENNI